MAMNRTATPKGMQPNMKAAAKLPGAARRTMAQMGKNVVPASVKGKKK